VRGQELLKHLGDIEFALIVFGVLPLLLRNEILQPLVFQFQLRDAGFQNGVFLGSFLHGTLKRLLSLLLFNTETGTGCCVPATFILLGYFLGDQWEFVLSRLQDNIFEGTLIVLAILALIWILRKKLIRLK